MLYHRLFFSIFIYMYKRCKLERLSSVDCKRITKIYNIKQNINSDFTKFIYNYIQNKNYKGG
ncbi:competence protein ComK, partial [Bacillus toyonensis]